MIAIIIGYTILNPKESLPVWQNFQCFWECFWFFECFERKLLFKLVGYNYHFLLEWFL